MQANYFYKCNICGAICNLKYQVGFLHKHPIRFKCNCGITIKGEFSDSNGIALENATETTSTSADYIVHCSGEFLTPKMHNTSKNYPMGLTSFILATSMMENYEEFQKVFSSLINYRESRAIHVSAMNELYDAHNTEMLYKLIRTKFDPTERAFPLNNEADIIRAVSAINQFQFLGYDNNTNLVKELFVSCHKKNTNECIKYYNYLASLDELENWKHKTRLLCEQFYSKVDLLLPAIGVDYYKDKSLILNGDFEITTTSFEDIKQLYVDLYELIASLLIIPIGLDNIILRGDFNKIKTVQGLNVKSLQDIPAMRNKGNIIKLLESDAPFQSLLCKCLNADIRNAIGHFSYHNEEVASKKGQSIRFYDPKNKDDILELSLVEICYDIWCMYKSLAVFNELIHNIELQIFIKETGILPSYSTDKALFNRLKTSTPKKIYPNEPCPCGSGLKYKKCCKIKDTYTRI